MEPLIFVSLTFIFAFLSIPLFKVLKSKIHWPEEKIAGLTTMLCVAVPLVYSAYLVNRFQNFVWDLLVLISLPYVFYLGSSNYKFFRDRKAKKTKD